MFLGATIGHALCTGFAVIGGRMIAQKISVRTGQSVKKVFVFGETGRRNVPKNGLIISFSRMNIHTSA